MSPNLPASGRVRSAAEEINEQIRAFWIGPGAHPTVPLSREQRAEYERLLTELRRVEREDVTAVV
ncbi:hypothetical protein [Streptomyces sp. NPDC051636]|uniref:hypothetical protein n=1 Tax=Streptomyces sp. NPDC051636 TaxID=3365663 RepID=UPI0037BD33F2